MAFDKYVNGAWQEPEAVKRYSDGAWVECESAKKYTDGAWQEVWSAIKYLIEMSNDISVGELLISSDGLSLDLYKEQHGSDGSIAGSGTIVFYVDGNWTNPTISFDWNGAAVRSNSSETTWYMYSAGSISIYTRTTDGTEGGASAVSSVGTTATYEEYPGYDEGSFSTTLEGTYNRLGIKIAIRGWNGTFYNAFVNIAMKNLKFNSTKIAFPASSEFDYT